MSSERLETVTMLSSLNGWGISSSNGRRLVMSLERSEMVTMLSYLNGWGTSSSNVFRTFRDGHDVELFKRLGDFV